MDVLSDVLSAMRLSGGVVFDAEFGAPWCVASQYVPEDCAAFFPVPAHVIAYHYVTKGRFWVQVQGQEPAPVEAGEIILLPRNERHLMFSEPGLEPLVLERAPVGEARDGPIRFRHDGAGERVAMYCGYLGSTSPEPALLQNLPSLMKVKLESDAREAWMESTMRLAAEELQAAAPETVARIAELLFSEAVKRYAETLPEGESGWLAGLRDPAVAKALALIHARYAECWDVNRLAREVGMSRSALAERFAALIGEPPMRYCARWRMRMAANMLRDGRQSAGNIAYEVGFNSEAAFVRAFKREYGEPPATWRRRQAAEAELAASDVITAIPVPPAQQVRYCAAADGTKLAYSVIGEGPPLVKAANWLNHIEQDQESPLWRHWLVALTRDHSLVRYDERGTGLSDWDTPDITFDAFVDDLETVADAVGLERFDLLGISQGAAVSIAYAVRHPERVRRMVILGGYATGWAMRADPDEIARREALITLTRAGWGQNNPAYRQLFTTLYIPGATPEQASWFADTQRLSASPANAERLQRVFGGIDVRALLPQVSVPTLVFHARDDAVVPFMAGERIAARIPGATFVPLDSRNHLLLETEPAWPQFLAAVGAFLRADG